MTDTSWMAEGTCREHPPNVFFPQDGVGVESRPQDLRHLSGSGGMPRVRRQQSH